MRLHIFVLAMAAVLGLAAAPAQQPTFKVGVDLVSVDALITVNRQPVPGLQAADFDVRDNGVPQRLDRVDGGALKAVPLDVVLTFDTSESMAGIRLPQLVDAGRGVLERLRRIDRAALVTFSDRTLIEHRLSLDLGAIRDALDNIRAVGRTSMFDALYVALMQPRSPDTRSMVLLFSDGLDNSSWLNESQLLQVARESDSVVYAVGLDAGLRGQVEDLVSQTGGEVVIADSPGHLKTLFVRLLTEMQARYVLTYYPEGVKREGWHDIQVRVRGRNVNVRARRGYYVPVR